MSPEEAMSYQDPTVQYPPPGPPPPGAGPEYQTMPLPPDDYVDDDEEWVNQAPKGLRIPPILGILALVLFAVSGFWGGAALQKHHDKTTRTTTGAGAAGFAGLAAGRRAAAAAAAGGTGSTGTGTGATGGAGLGGRTLGTVSDVEGSTVFLTDSAGNILKVNLSPTTKITMTTTGTAADIQLGQSLIVSGAKGTDGSTAAATVTIVPAGTTGFGGTGTGTGTGAGGGGGAATGG
jgi:hypothetical protein